MEKKENLIDDDEVLYADREHDLVNTMSLMKLHINKKPITKLPSFFKKWNTEQLLNELADFSPDEDDFEKTPET